MTYADDHAANPCNRCQSPPGVRCEHDEPTPTPAPGLDLDAVEAAERAMTSGPWHVHVLPSSPASGLLVFDVGPSDDHPIATTSGTDTESIDEAEANAHGLVALRNAAPALLAEVRRLRVQVDEREADMHMRIRAGYDKTVADAWRAEVAKRDAEIARLTAELARVTECYSESHAAVGQLTRDIDAGREIDRQNVAEVNRLTAELAAARAVPADVEAAIRDLKIAAADFGIAQDGVTTGHAFATEHRGEASARMRSAADHLRTAIARAISDATAARGTVGGLLATAPNLSDDEGQYVANRIGLTYELSTDAGRGRAIKAMRAAEEIIARGPLPKGG